MNLPGSAAEAYIARLLTGDRIACREYVNDHLRTGVNAWALYEDVLWPAMERIERLFRGDRINTASEHMATRINRSIADQLQVNLQREPSNGKRILIVCADGEPEELGAVMCADLFEARGWDVYFVGGGVPNDEVLGLVGQLRPDILLIYGTQPSGVPGVRRLVDMIREVGSNPTMNVMVSGGVFNRADGLWKEVNAELHARNVKEALALAEQAEPCTTPVRASRAPRRRRRRRTPAPVTAEAS
jgi:methanogenic corrinoid protein MtbC1